jgi:hypothetical protein
LDRGAAAERRNRHGPTPALGTGRTGGRHAAMVAGGALSSVIPAG